MKKKLFGMLLCLVLALGMSTIVLTENLGAEDSRTGLGFSRGDNAPHVHTSPIDPSLMEVCRISGWVKMPADSTSVLNMSSIYRLDTNAEIIITEADLGHISHFIAESINRGVPVHLDGHVTDALRKTGLESTLYRRVGELTAAPQN